MWDDGPPGSAGFQDGVPDGKRRAAGLTVVVDAAAGVGRCRVVADGVVVDRKRRAAELTVVVNAAAIAGRGGRVAADGAVADGQRRLPRS